MISLRRFLLVTVLATLVLVIFVSALHGYQRSMLAASKVLDDKLQALAQQLLSLPQPPQALALAAGDDTVFQLIGDDEVIYWRSALTPETPLPVIDGFKEINFSGHRWQAYGQWRDSPRRRVVVAERIDLRFGLAEGIVLESILPVLLGLPVAGLLIWLILSYGLRGLADLALKLRRKSSDDLQPVVLSSLPQELAPVVESVNSMMSRLRSAFERERRFSADAAHELRTPLAAIRMHLHNAMQAPELPGDSPLAHSLAQLHDDLQRLSHLVEQMLDLHRTEPEHYPANFESLDLAVLSRDVIAKFYPLLAAKEQDIALSGSAPKVLGDRFALEILLQNLLSNANKYTPRAGHIEVVLEEESGAATLCVRDSGAGIPEAERERIFERFYRVGGDRHASGEGGCGLGLSIVSHIAVLHGAELRLGPGIEGSGLSVCLFFPPRSYDHRHDRRRASAQVKQ